MPQPLPPTDPSRPTVSARLRWGLIVGILGLWAIAYVWQSGSVSLVDETEPLFSEAARQMGVTGDWITPYFNGATRFDKPPLIYWLTAIAYRLLGVNEWAVRLPSGLAALAVIAAGFATLWRFGVTQQVAKSQPRLPWWVAALGAGTIALTPQTIAWGRVGVSDMLLTGCLATALLGFFWGYASDRRIHKRLGYGAFYTLMALAVLTKGPVGVVLPGLIVVAFALYLGEAKALWREAKPLLGLAWVAGLSLPWFLAVIAIHGETYIKSFFGYHNLQRFTEVVNQHASPWYFYFIVVFVGFLPWSPYLPLAIAAIQPWRRLWWQQQPRRDRLGLFALVWLLGVFGFFTLAVTKLPSYVLPLMPAAGILVALLWRDGLTGQWAARPRWLRPGRAAALELGDRQAEVGPGVHWTAIGAIASLALLALALAAQGVWLPLIKDPTMPNLTTELEASGAITIGAIIWGITAIGGGCLIVLRRYPWLWGLTFAATLIFFVGSVLPLTNVLDAQRQLPLRQISAEIVRQRQPDEPLVMVGFGKPSVAFYTQSPVLFSQRVGQAIAQVGQDYGQKRGPWGKSSTLLVLGDRHKLHETRLDQLGAAISAAGIYQVRRIDRDQFMAHQPPSDPDD